MFLSSGSTLPCLLLRSLYSKESVYALWMLPILQERTTEHLWDSKHRTTRLAPLPIDTAAVIRFQGWWTFVRTLTYTHSQHMETRITCLFLQNVIKSCSDTAWRGLCWNGGALPSLFLPELSWFIQRLPHTTLQPACFFAPSKLQNRFISMPHHCHLQDVQPWAKPGGWDFCFPFICTTHTLLAPFFMTCSRLVTVQFLCWVTEKSWEQRVWKKIKICMIINCITGNSIQCLQCFAVSRTPLYCSWEICW